MIFQSTVKTTNVTYHVSRHGPQLQIFLNIFPVSLFNYAHFVSFKLTLPGVCTYVMASFGGRVNITVALALYEITSNSV